MDNEQTVGLGAQEEVLSNETTSDTASDNTASTTEDNTTATGNNTASTTEDNTTAEPERLSPAEVEKRIEARLAKEQRIAQRREQQLLDIVQANQNTQNNGQSNTQQVPGIDLSRQPTLNDFGGNWEQYVDALSTWKAVAAITIRDQQEQQVKQQEQARVRSVEWNKKVNQIEKIYPDYKEVMLDNTDTQVPNDVHALVQESDIGPALYYHMATHQEFIDSITNMTPVQRARAVLKLEASLEPKIVERTSGGKVSNINKNASKAPAPIGTVKGSSSVSTGDLYDPNLSQADFRRMRQEAYLTKMNLTKK